jgi:hypothetical protein
VQVGDDPGGVEPLPLAGGEPVGGAHQQPADPVQRIVCAPAMAGQLLLDTAADLIHAGIREPDQVEVVGDQPGVAETSVVAGDGGLVPGVRIDRHLGDAREPRRVTVIEPRADRGGGAALDDVEQPTTADVDHAGDIHAPAIA